VTAIPADIIVAKAALIRASGGPHRPLDQWRVVQKEKMPILTNLNADGMRRPYVIYDSRQFWAIVITEAEQPLKGAQSALSRRITARLSLPDQSDLQPVFWLRETLQKSAEFQQILSLFTA
jgi:hypothetical protein